MLTKAQILCNWLKVDEKDKDTNLYLKLYNLSDKDFDRALDSFCDCGLEHR